MEPLHLLMSSEILDAHYDEENAWLYLDWKGPQEVVQVQAACQWISDFLRHTSVQKALNDNTHITQTSLELVRWIASEYLPLAAQAGVEYVAWVYSPVLGCQSHVDLIPLLSDQKLQIAFFDDVATACTWLGSISIPVTY